MLSSLENRGGSLEVGESGASREGSGGELGTAAAVGMGEEAVTQSSIDAGARRGGIEPEVSSHFRESVGKGPVEDMLKTGTPFVRRSAKV
jgi:hypothetical protein